MSISSGVFLFIICLGSFVVGAMFAKMSYNERIDSAAFLIKECEKDLPRNKYCKLIAVEDKDSDHEKD